MENGVADEANELKKIVGFSRPKEELDLALDQGAQIPHWNKE